ncbi:MAG: 6-phosphogluconolactonase [Gammaproteobacteria bacterium]|nr:6-phosphogluconolactonase [Gammaproteobacteria bacterium]
MAWTEHAYTGFEALAEAVARHLHAACARAIEQRGEALLALAGGRTPLPLYRRLATHALPWSRVRVLPTDERCVPHGHAACNLDQVRTAFIAAQHVQLAGLTTPDGDPDRSLTHGLAMLARHRGAFDAVVLGMGDDGHTASLFPGAEGLSAALDPASTVDACRIDPDPLPPEAPYPRITLTVARLLRTRVLHLVVTGADKRTIVQRAQASGDRLRYPVAAILHAPDTCVDIHWSP